MRMTPVVVENIQTGQVGVATSITANPDYPTQRYVVVGPRGKTFWRVDYCQELPGTPLYKPFQAIAEPFPVYNKNLCRAGMVYAINGEDYYVTYRRPRTELGRTCIFGKWTKKACRPINMEEYRLDKIIFKYNRR